MGRGPTMFTMGWLGGWSEVWAGKDWSGKEVGGIAWFVGVWLVGLVGGWTGGIGGWVVGPLGEWVVGPVGDWVVGLVDVSRVLGRLVGMSCWSSLCTQRASPMSGPQTSSRLLAGSSAAGNSEKCSGRNPYTSCPAKLQATGPKSHTRPTGGPSYSLRWCNSLIH